MKKDIVIIGSGPAGLGCAYHLEDSDYILLEKEDKPGGLMRSKLIDGFTFDLAGHIFFTKIPYIKAFLEELLKDNYHIQYRESFIYSKATFTRYPFQANTYGLPIEVVKQCLVGFFEARLKYNDKKPTNFKEWIYHTFGNGIAEHFMIPYNNKVWAYPLEQIACDWLLERVPNPTMEEVVDGALRRHAKNLGPNSWFGYPLRGGCEALVKAMMTKIKQFKVKAEVTAIDLKNKTVRINDSDEIGYDRLISTVPLPELVNMAQGTPEEVRQAARGLETTSVICANIGVKEPHCTEKHWVYYPEPEFLTQRIFVQGNASPYCCPPGCFSFTNEITYSKRKPIDRKSIIERSIQDLIRCGFIQTPSQVIVTDIVDIPWGYVIYTHDRAERVKACRTFFTKYDIHLLGRYAEWEYYNMDHALMAGKRLADRLEGRE